MSRKPAEKMTEVRIDVNRYPGITEKFRRIMARYDMQHYTQVVIRLVNDCIEKIDRQERLEERRK